MRVSESSKSRRVLACILGIMVLFVLLFSSFYIALESGHECDGHDCPVCSIIKQCEAVIRVFKESRKTLVSAILPVLFLCLTLHLVPVFTSSETPVTEKVRLNN